MTQARHKNTACFVHSLLESQRSRGILNGGLDGIAETLRSTRIDTGQNGLDGERAANHEAEATSEDQNNKPIDPKVGGENKQKDNDSGNATPQTQLNILGGQADEEAWQRRHSGIDTPRKLDADPAATHSRLLTKRQLSDMAWGVRELSKRLGSIKLKLKVRTVFLLTKAHDEELIGNTREVARWLLSPDRQVRYTVYVEENLKENEKFDSKGLLQELAELEDKKEKDGGEVKRGERLRYWNDEMCRSRPHTFDFIVTLGGDGTVLYASWLFQRIVPPVLSFALGSLGFLTKFDYEDFQGCLTRAFRDGVTVSLRLRFEGTVMRHQEREGAGERDLVEELVGEEKEDERTHRPDGTYEILNDIVVDRGPNPSTCSFTLDFSNLTYSSNVLDRNLW